MAGVYRLCFQLSRNLVSGRFNCNNAKSIRYRSTLSKISSSVYRLPSAVGLRYYAVAANSKEEHHHHHHHEQQKQQRLEEGEDEEERKKRKDAARKTKYTLIGLGSFIGLLGGYLVFTLGVPHRDEEGNIIEDEFSSLPFISQIFRRMLHELDHYNKIIKQPSRDKLLPDPLPLPYQQPPYTLVLEMRDLLVHPEWTYQTGWRFKKRPGVDKFLEQVTMPNFEVVVFTAEQGLTVFPLLDALDPNGYIMYRLVRDSTDFVDGHHVKNLSCLNRDLSKVIVIDWNANSVKFHRENTLLIPQWMGQDDDTALADLAAFLKTIVTTGVEDVRDVLSYYGQFENPIEAFRENQRKLLEQLEEEEKVKKKKGPSLTSRWSSSFLHK